MQVHLTLKSSNKKTGRIPVSTTEQASCPSTCPFNSNNEGGCYAGSGPLKLHWDKVSRCERGQSWDNFCNTIEGFNQGQLWRHNQAGDLPHNNGAIDIDKVERLVSANEGRRGFTYTHHDVSDIVNYSIIRKANDDGFTINVSANSAKDAVHYMENYSDLPVVCVVDSEETRKQFTIEGHRFITCPATYKDNVSCASCKLCSVRNRDYAIAFPAHGTSKKKANKVANEVAI